MEILIWRGFCDDSSQRPTLFYLFARDKNIEIKPMTDVEADAQWKQGKRWLVVPQKMQVAAEALRQVLLKQFTRKAGEPRQQRPELKP